MKNFLKEFNALNEEFAKNPLTEDQVKQLILELTKAKMNFKIFLLPKMSAEQKKQAYTYIVENGLEPVNKLMNVDYFAINSETQKLIEILNKEVLDLAFFSLKTFYSF